MPQQRSWEKDPINLLSLKLARYYTSVTWFIYSHPRQYRPPDLESDEISTSGFHWVEEGMNRTVRCLESNMACRATKEEGLLWEVSGCNPQKHFWFWSKEQCFRKVVRLSHDGRSKLENKIWDRNENTILPEYSLARVFPIKSTNFNFFPNLASFFSGYRISEHYIRLAGLKLHAYLPLDSPWLLKETAWLTWPLATRLPSVMSKQDPRSHIKLVDTP